MGAHQEAASRAASGTAKLYGGGACTSGSTSASAIGSIVELNGNDAVLARAHTVGLEEQRLVTTRPSDSHSADGSHQQQWYAAYTSANHERRVAEQCAARGIEHFLPQYESIRKWKDRKVRLQLPLFPGYIFVRIALAKRLRVLEVPGVARLVGFDGHPTPIPEADLLRVRDFLRQGFRAEPHRVLKVGRRVRVKSGPLTGMEGVVARRKNGSRFVISFALIQRAIAVDVEAMNLETLG